MFFERLKFLFFLCPDGGAGNGGNDGDDGKDDGKNGELSAADEMKKLQDEHNARMKELQKKLEDEKAAHAKDLREALLRGNGNEQTEETAAQRIYAQMKKKYSK
jgi:hypothetical protein